jgi:prophage maintenance system killer protein
MFLDLNGCSFHAPESEVVIFFENLASSDIAEDELADWFIASSNKIA